MQVPYRLRRRLEPEPATALLLSSHRPADLAALCASLESDCLPRIFRVADGFLLKLARPITRAVPGVIRLRGLSENLLLPVDADLSPALLADEAAALVRQRGLIFLPGGRALAFVPAEPLRPSAWVGVAGLRRAAWQALPEPPHLADRLTEVVLDLPGESPDEVLDPGGEGIGTEAPRAPEAGLPQKALGQAAFKAGKALSWLGQALGLGGLSRAGAQWIEKALALSPRLAEKLLGRQEASLRDLLEDFRQGNIERALRRALPLAGPNRGAGPHTDSQLPTHDLRYSLRNILGQGGGPGSIWHSSSEVYEALEREYRKLAEQATRDGDHRRAAFIYGKLLADYRQAALVLSRGGLHRDAAILYLTKLDDSQAAAQEFEAAGDVDRALQLYRQSGKHALAGDLLRRAGEEELAIAEYRLAADKQLISDHGYYQAGELMRERARRPDLALIYYEQGWARRPSGSSIPCAVRMAQVYAADEAVQKLRGLLNEADPFLQMPGNDSSAADFYNEVARLTDRPALTDVQDELRDRALMGLAGKMRQRLHVDRNNGAVVSAMLGTSSAWAATLVSDARFAARHAVRQGPSTIATSVVVAVRPRIARVSAVCQAKETGDIFLGCESGEVVCFHPCSGEVIFIVDERAPILSLAVSDDAQVLVVLSHTGPGTVSVKAFTLYLDYHLASSRNLEAGAEAWLCPALISNRMDQIVGLWTGKVMQRLAWPGLLHLETEERDEGEHVPVTALQLAGETQAEPWEVTLLFDASGVSYRYKGRLTRMGLGWGPELPERSTLRQAPLCWLSKGVGSLEVAALCRGQTPFWADLSLQDHAGVLRRLAVGRTSGVQALQIVSSGLLAAVTPTAIQWLRPAEKGLQVVQETKVSLPQAVACFPYHRGNDLIVVCADGTVARVPGLGS